jgi:PAS domain S-box-containing protein
MNKKAGQIFNRDPEEMLGKHIWTEFPEGVGQPFYHAYHKAFETQQYLYLEEHYKPYDLWFENHIYPSPNGLSIYFRDITESKKAAQRIEASERYFRTLIEKSIDGIVLMDRQGKIRYHSPSTERITGFSFEELHGADSTRFVEQHWQKDQKDLISSISHIPGASVKTMFQARHKNDLIIWIEGTYTNWLHDENIASIVLNFQDVSEKVQGQEKLNEEKTLTDSVINSVPGILYLYDRNFKFLRWNRNLEVVVGRSSAEMLNANPIDFFPDDEKAIVQRKIEEVFERGKAEVTAHIIDPVKGPTPYYFNGHRVVLNNQECLVGMGIDISLRVKAENELKEHTEEIRKLTGYLQNIREEERTHIAREIHDVVGQQLTAMKMEAYWLKKKFPQYAEDERLLSLLKLIDETIKTVRRVSSDLRPGILDDLGLVAALEWQTAEFSKNTGMEAIFHNEVEIDNIDSNIATNVFRIYQESLTNVARHSQASKIFASLQIKDSALILTISDNGKGFDITEVRRKKSLGLVGMRERARMLDGSIEFKRGADGGTEVSLAIPLKHVTLQS